MNPPLIITPEAEEDLVEAKAWYDGQRRGLGGDFLLCVEEAFDRIRCIPEGQAKSTQEYGAWLYGVFLMASSTEWTQTKLL